MRPFLSCFSIAVVTCVIGACATAESPAAVAGAAGPDIGWAFPSDHVAATLGAKGMVSTTDRVASEIGAEIIRRGGNAIDAAVATHFALAVVNPEAGNIGGGGFMIVRLADGTSATLDFREKAPLAATRDMFLAADGSTTDRSLVGHLAAGVPGSVAGMWAAHQRFGSLRWQDLVQPAITLAEGLVVHERLASSLREYQDRLQTYPATAKTFLLDGRAPNVGERFVQRDLAESLRRIAVEGRDGFYRGRTAALVDAEMRRGGGLITLEDLGRYEAIWRDPVTFQYRGRTVISMAPPSSGGATLAEILNILEGYDLRSLGYLSADHVHVWSEAVKRAYIDRNTYLADPDFVSQPTARMISDAYATQRRTEIHLERATPSAQVRPGLGPLCGPERESRSRGDPHSGPGREERGERYRRPAEGLCGDINGQRPLAGPVPVEQSTARREGDHTTHYSIVDATGNAVAVTTTINSLYGNRVTVAGAGFLLNNEMDDFATKPGAANQFGLVQGEANAVQPGKRMLSAMTPVILVGADGKVELVTGTPGGATIVTTVAQMVSNIVDFGMDLASATGAPRLHHQHLPDVVRFEHSGLGENVVADLHRRGQIVEERAGYQGDTQSIQVLQTGVLVGVADPRRGGAAVAVASTRQVVQ